MKFKVVAGPRRTYPQRSDVSPDFRMLGKRLSSLGESESEHRGGTPAKCQKLDFGVAVAQPNETPPFVKARLASPDVSTTVSDSPVSWRKNGVFYQDTQFVPGPLVEGAYGRVHYLTHSDDLSDRSQVIAFNQDGGKQYVDGPGILPVRRGVIPIAPTQEESRGLVIPDHLLEGFSIRERVSYVGEKLNHVSTLLRMDSASTLADHTSSREFARYIFMVSLMLDVTRPIQTIHDQGLNMGEYGTTNYVYKEGRLYLDCPARLDSVVVSGARSSFSSDRYGSSLKRGHNSLVDGGLYTAPEVGIMARVSTDNTYYPEVPYHTPLELKEIIGDHAPLSKDFFRGTPGQKNDVWTMAMMMCHIISGAHLFEDMSSDIQELLDDIIPFNLRATQSRYQEDWKDLFGKAETVYEPELNTSIASFESYLERSQVYLEAMESKQRESSSHPSMYVKLLQAYNKKLDAHVPYLSPLKPLLFSCLSPHADQRPSMPLVRETLRECRSKLPFFGEIHEPVFSAEYERLKHAFSVVMENYAHKPSHLGETIKARITAKESKLRQDREMKLVSLRSEFKVREDQRMAAIRKRAYLESQRVSSSRDVDSDEDVVVWVEPDRRDLHGNKARTVWEHGRPVVYSETEFKARFSSNIDL